MSIFAGLDDSSGSNIDFSLSLSYQGLNEIPEDVIKKHSKQTTSLDLSYNIFKCLISLRQFDQLHTVILDHNALDEHFCFPGKFPAIKLLSVNGNKIANLSVFVNRMSQDLPNLTFLSMMKNDAAPSYFNGGTKSQNEDYRSYVISHFPKLRNLDGWPILDGEREQAYRLYGKRWKIKKRTASSYT
ncbi:leucine-rich melanocyte differentiation-associated protein-like [Clytia hemisphaerica]|uniref:Leucine rich repeat containing protein n=1 Tax=Clytia hemisphaerica TaxID=252671 RepID=A0A7M5XGH5_9CNID|eukprot:TCONS_00042911-protein